MRQFKFYLIALLLMCTHPYALAYTDDDNDDFSGWISMEAGVAYMQADNQTVTQGTPLMDRPNIYVTNKIDNTAVVGAGLGFAFALAGEDDFFPATRLGVYYDYYIPTNVYGTIENEQSVIAFTYTLQARSNTLWLNDQLDLFNWNNIIPFLEGGIGIAFNSIYDYEETLVLENPGQSNKSAAFESNSSTSFAWRAGAGVNVILPRGLERFTLGFLYRYSDRGDITSGPSETYPTQDKGLGTPSKSNDVMISLTYSDFYYDQ